MKLLLIGPYPPPHGGISVHVAETRRRMAEAHVCCQVVNVDRRSPLSPEYIRIRGGLHLALVVLAYAVRGWTVHVHTNGHNWKSWLIARVCGMAGRFAPGRLLTLHSGMTRAWLAAGSGCRRRQARKICRLYDRVIAVNPEIRRALLSLGVPAEKVEVLPAFLALPARLPARLSVARTEVALQSVVKAFLHMHRPVLSTSLFFRPEYGFHVLVPALVRLRGRHPRLGCLVMGGGEQFDQAVRVVRQQGLQDAVLLLGDVPHDTCLALMSLSNLFVRPTLRDADAISVREALALGVPVVASDVGTRPRGVHLFRPGHVDDLVSAIEIALMGRPSEPRLASAPAAGSFDRLVEIYQKLGRPLPAAREARGLSLHG